MTAPRRPLVVAALAALVLTVAIAAVVFAQASSTGDGTLLGVVQPEGATTPVPHGGDAADDPAIWVDPRDPGRSLVLGTDKKGGLAVYDLDGAERQYLEGGNPNNVDLRYDFPLAGRTVALVAAGDRSDDTIVLWAVDEEARRLREVPTAGRLELGIEVYGSCLSRSPTGRYSFFGTSEEGEVEQWELFDDGGRVAARRVRSFDLGSQTEGCVVDDERGALYLDEEAVGVWRYGSEPSDGDHRTRVDGARRDRPLVPDVEGIALAGDHLVVSSQGDDSFAVYEREGDNAYVGSFRVEGVESTDGLDATTRPLGPRFPEGLLVVQDGHNGEEHQDFALVRWGDVTGLLPGG